MSRSKKNVIEYRIYELSADRPYLCLTGDIWRISDVLSNRLHFHNCLEIGFCHSDSGFLGFEDGETVPFKAGDVFLIPRFVPHTTCSSKGCRSLWSYLFIDLDAIGRAMGVGPGAREESISSLIGAYLPATRESQPRLHFLCTCLLEEAIKRAQDDPLLFRIYGCALTAELQRLLSTKDIKPPVGSRAFVLKPVLEYINDHYMEPCSIETLSGICHLSQTHFRRLFLSIMGTAPLQYVIQMRIRQACIRLHTTSEPITAIAQAVGINSISSFNRNFQQIMGLSPQQYRNLRGKSVQAKQKQYILPYKGWTEPEDLTEEE